MASDRPRVRVRGRTKEQRQADQDEVDEAAWEAVRSFIEGGYLHPCAEHDEWDPDCKRCEWVNDKLSRGEYR